MSKIIVLNGCGSSGKTSIGRAIQHLSDQPWLLLGVDAFIDMLPERYIIDGDKAHEGYFSFIPGNNEHGSTMRIHDGPLSKQVFGCLPSLCKLLADAGNNLIIDEVILNNELFTSYQLALKTHSTCFVGVYCDLPTLQKREQARQDRHIGLSNDQFSKVHQHKNYDLTVDTSQTTAEDIAKQILLFSAQHLKNA